MYTNLQNKRYKVGLYIRLSKEDLDKKSESYSIKNQRALLENYVHDNGYILVDTFIDDGYTGTNFKRPGFIKMIKAIENKKIDMVITKDLSRLGREYIETGEYVEKYFPSHNIRFVSLLDGIDTYYDNANNDIAPFKAIINDMYSRDNSKKIRAALHTLQKKGKWVGGCPPLGYMVDPLDKNHLVINSDEAYVVKKIFNLAKQNNSIYQIKEILDLEKIPTASQLRKKRGKCALAEKGIWSTKTIYNILKNPLYTGDMVQNRGQRISYKIRKNIKNAKEDWIIVPNTHEALIDKQLFLDIQNTITKSRIKTKKKFHRLLDGLLYCSECSHHLSIYKKGNKTYTICNTYRTNSKLRLCTTHSNNYDLLEDVIIKSLQKTISKYLKDIKDKNIMKNINLKINDHSELSLLEHQISFKQEQLDELYLDKLDQKITADMYERIKQKIIMNINELRKRYLEIKKEYDNSYKRMDNLNNLHHLPNELLIMFVKKITITQNKKIVIHLNFSEK